MAKKVDDDIVPKTEVAHAQTVVQATKVDHADVVELTGGSTEDARLKAAQDSAHSEEAYHSLGQRRVNLIWEMTQAVVAIAVTLTTLAISGYMAIQPSRSEGAFLLLSNVFFLVVGTYFQRTNHTKVGGVGPQLDHR